MTNDEINKTEADLLISGEYRPELSQPFRDSGQKLEAEGLRTVYLG